MKGWKTPTTLILTSDMPKRYRVIKREDKCFKKKLYKGKGTFKKLLGWTID